MVTPWKRENLEIGKSILDSLTLWEEFFTLFYMDVLSVTICSTLGTFVREGNGNQLQYSCLENPMDGGACWAAVHGVAKSQTRLSDFPFTFHFPALEKDMATHSSVLAWRIPGMGEPSGLLSMGSHRVGHDWRDLAAAAVAGTFVACRRDIKDKCSLYLDLLSSEWEDLSSLLELSMTVWLFISK